MAKFIRPGDVIEVTVAAETTVGDVVPVGTSRISVAGDSAKSGETINCYVVGVYAIEKKSNLAISQGDVVYFNASSKKITKTDSDIPAGFAVADAASADETVLVKID